jgi:hypothetical protein
LPACAFGTADNSCRTTAVGADARRDAEGHEVHVYDYRFVPDSRCGDTHVNASYNVFTREAQEKLQRPGATATGVWLCPSDPWSGVSECAKVDVQFSGNVQPTQQDLDNFERAGIPISIYPLIQIDKDTLRGQLGNALKQLPPLVIERGDAVVRVGGSAAVDVISNVLPGATAKDDAPGPAPQPTSPGTGAIVEKGAAGPNVEAIQYLLNQSGEDVMVDGDFGDQTDVAVRDLQRKKNLPQDGKVGPLTWAALWLTVRNGSGEGDAVQAAQTLLNWHMANIAIDGDFGDQTEVAVRSFQGAKGLPVDGVVGRQTWTALVNRP